VLAAFGKAYIFAFCVLSFSVRDLRAKKGLSLKILFSLKRYFITVKYAMHTYFTLF